MGESIYEIEAEHKEMLQKVKKTHERNKESIEIRKKRAISLENFRREFVMLIWKNLEFKEEGYITYKDYGKEIADLFLEKLYEPIVKRDNFLDRVEPIFREMIADRQEKENIAHGEASKKYWDVFDDRIEKKRKQLHSKIDFMAELYQLKQQFPSYTQDFDLKRYEKEYYDMQKKYEEEYNKRLKKNTARDLCNKDFNGEEHKINQE